MSKGNINYKYLKRRKSWFRRNLTLVIFIAVVVIAIAGAVTAGIMLSHYNKENRMIIMGVMMNRQLFQQKRQQRQEKLCGLIIKSLNQRTRIHCTRRSLSSIFY